MMQEHKLKRRVVTKRAYVAKLGAKTTLASIGLGIFLFGVICGLTALISAAFLLLNFNPGTLLVSLFMLGIFGGGSAYLLYIGRRTVKEARAIDAGVPLTRANTGDLPAPQSLVRASQEPVQALQTVLLRGATGAATTPTAQLVRAYQEPAQEELGLLQHESLVTVTASLEPEVVEQRLGARPFE